MVVAIIKTLITVIIVIMKIVIIVVSLLIAMVEKNLCNRIFKLKIQRINQKIKG